jgi:zinc protease
MIDAVTAGEVQAAAQKYLSPQSMIVIAVGDRSQIESEMKQLDLGPTEIVDLEGNPLK